MPRSAKAARWLGVAALVALTFALGYWGARQYRVQPVASEASPENRGYQPGVTPEYVLVYIGSAGCAVCQDEYLPGYIDIISTQLREDAKADSATYRSVGIAIDFVADVGIEHLSSISSFGEIISGSSWTNSGVLKYVWDTFPGEPSTPQVVVVRRDVMMSQTSMSVQNERVVRRVVGLPAIQRWAES